MAHVRVGDWTLDITDGTLSSQSGSKRLEPKTLAVLLLLIDRCGEVVGPEEMFAEVWRGTHVAPGALARSISLLRHALEDDVREPRYIKTIPKRGYRLIAVVETIQGSDVGRTAPVSAVSSGSWRRTRVAAAAMLFVLAANHDAPRQPINRASQEAVALPRRPGVFHERLWHDTRLGNETAFEYYTRELRREPASVDALSGLAMVYAFRTLYRPDQRRLVDEALDMAVRATAIDPSSAVATRALAVAYAQAGRLADAATAFQRAILLCPDDSASRTNLGYTLGRAGRFDAALKVFDYQFAAEPQWVHTYAYASAALADAGYLDEAARLAEVGIEREPLLLIAHLTVAETDLVRGRTASARARLQRMIDAYADYAPIVVLLGLAEELEGHIDQARDTYERARTMTPSTPEAALRLAHLRWLDSGQAGAEPLLREVESDARSQISMGVDASRPRWVLAAAAAIRGDRAMAIRWYSRALAAGHGDVLWDARDPLLESIRQTPEFRQLSEATFSEHLSLAPLVARLIGRIPTAGGQLD